MVDNKFEYEVFGKNALFTDPMFRAEKLSYPVPTYQSIIGITSSLYWKPTLFYVIDQVRIMNPIEMESKGVRPLDKSLSLDHNSLAYYSYLSDVRYQVRGHFEWNMQRDDLSQDRNVNKHSAIFKRSLKAGGRRDIFLGTRECQGYVKPAKFGAGAGAYDNSGEIDFGQMFFGYQYPNENESNEFGVKFWHVKMTDGVIVFPKPDEIKSVQKIRDVSLLPTDYPKLTQSVDELYAEMNGGDD